MDNYDDIINLEHYEPKYHPRMSKYNRAAQFAPFMALTGYEDQVEETARLTNTKHELSDEEIEKLNYKLLSINERIKEKPLIKVTYFIKDTKKSGGEYKTIVDNVKRIDFINNFIKLSNNDIINLEDIYDIDLKEEEYYD